MITTTSVLPPEMSFAFSPNLLNNTWGIEREIKNIDAYIEKAKDKYKPGSRKMREFNELIEAMKEFYEWYKKVQAYQKSENRESEERPLLDGSTILRFRGFLRFKILQLLENGLFAGYIKQTDEIQKIQGKK